MNIIELGAEADEIRAEIDQIKAEVEILEAVKDGIELAEGSGANETGKVK